MVFAGNGLKIVIDESVWRIFTNSRQVHMNSPESFGILIGTRDTIAQSYKIKRITTPGKKDVQSRHHFVLQDPQHQKTANQAFHNSGGYLGYLGTWHTHPEAIPSPSAIDIKDWLMCIERNPDRQLFFVIVGICGVNVYVGQGNEFDKLKELRSNKS